MKKSKLRNIIRESIKGLMNEQVTITCATVTFQAGCPNQGTQMYRSIYVTNSGNQSVGNAPGLCYQINGNPITQADVGTLVTFDPSTFGGGPYDSGPCDVWEIDTVDYPHQGTPSPLTVDTCNSGTCLTLLDCNDPAATNYNSAAYGCDNGSGFCDDPQVTGYNPVICKDNNSCCVYPPNTPPKPNDPKDEKGDIEKPEPTVPSGKGIEPSVVKPKKDDLKERMQKLANISKK